MYHILSPCTIFYVVCFNLYHIIVLYIIKQKVFEVTMNILGTRTKQKNNDDLCHKSREVYYIIGGQSTWNYKDNGRWY